MIGVMFLLALFIWVVILAVKYGKRQDPGAGGWWGPGWHRPRGPVGPPPKDPGPNPDGLLEIPQEWIEAHGKWAKQVVRENLKKIMVASGTH